MYSQVISIDNLTATFTVEKSHADVLSDNTHCFMNSSHIPQLVFEQNGESRNIINSDLYHQLLQEANL
jgi:hypothetical protein